MIIDCHYHLEPRMQPVDNLLRKMETAGIDQTALMGSIWDVPPHTPEFVLKLLRFILYHRLTRPVAKKLAAKFTPDGDIILPKATVEIYQDPDNAPVADAVARYPDKFLGWIFVNPRGHNDPVEEFDKWKDVPGFIGIKTHSFWHRFAPKELIPVAERAAAMGMPILNHVGFDAHGDFLALADAVPDLKLILAHAGFPAFSDTWKLIKDRPNIFVDLSADAYVNANATRQAVAYLGADRCLFGTDGPYGHVAADGIFDNGYIKQRIESLFPEQAVRAGLMGENFRRVIGR